MTKRTAADPMKALVAASFAVGVAAMLLSGPVLLSILTDVPPVPPGDPAVPLRFVLGRLALAAVLLGVGIGMVRTSIEGRALRCPDRSGVESVPVDTGERGVRAWTGVGTAGGAAILVASCFVEPSVHPAFAAAFVAFPLYAGGMRGSRRRTSFAIAALLLSAAAIALALGGFADGTLAARAPPEGLPSSVVGLADATPAWVWLALSAAGSAATAVAGTALGLRRS